MLSAFFLSDVLFCGYSAAIKWHRHRWSQMLCKTTVYVLLRHKCEHNGSASSYWAFFTFNIKAKSFKPSKYQPFFLQIVADFVHRLRYPKRTLWIWTETKLSECVFNHTIPPHPWRWWCVHIENIFTKLTWLHIIDGQSNKLKRRVHCTVHSALLNIWTRARRVKHANEFHCKVKWNCGWNRDT